MSCVRANDALECVVVVLEGLIDTKFEELKESFEDGDTEELARLYVSMETVLRYISAHSKAIAENWPDGINT